MDYIKKRKKGVTYIEVISSLFIIMLILSMILPNLIRKNNNSLDTVTNKVVDVLNYAKSLSISQNSKVKVEFHEEKEGGYKKIKVIDEDEEYREYKLKEFIIIANKNDIYNGCIVFKPDGTLFHRATTLKVKDIENKEERRITLTIGYTRIMRVD